MGFAWTTGQADAIGRLGSSYNGADYDSTTNPYGFGSGGHTVNFFPALQDIVTVAEGIEDAANAALQGALGENFPPTAPAGYGFSLIDDYGRAAWGTKNDGTTVFAAIETDELFAPSVIGDVVGTEGVQLIDESPGGFALTFTDELGKTPGGILPDGGLRWREADFDSADIGAIQTDSINSVPIATILAGGAGAGPPEVPAFTSDIMGVFSYGQSL